MVNNKNEFFNLLQNVNWPNKSEIYKNNQFTLIQNANIYINT